CTSSISSDFGYGSVTLTYTLPTATTTAVSAPASALRDTPVTYTATVSPAPKIGDGTVAFMVDGHPVNDCDARPFNDDDSGVATCDTVPEDAAGEHHVTATFTSTSDDLASSETTVDAVITTTRPDVSLSDDALDFGDLATGTEATRDLTVT